MATRAAADLIKRFEGRKLRAYQCPAGVWTIGYGHTKGVVPGELISPDRAEELLHQDLQPLGSAILRYATAPLNRNQLDALISFVFNLGIGAFANSSLLRKINAHDYTGAADAFLLWDKARVNGVLTVLPGLTARRNAERELFLKPEQPQ